jgi:hypothetical protein
MASLRGGLCFVERVLGEAEQDGRLADAGFPDEEELHHVVVLVGGSHGGLPWSALQVVRVVNGGDCAPRPFGGVP